VVLLIDAVIVLAEIVVAVLCTIEALPQGFLVVGIGRVWHRQRRLCRQRLSRLCRRLESGQIHGSKLFAHARGGLTVLLVALSNAASIESFSDDMSMLSMFVPFKIEVEACAGWLDKLGGGP